MPERYRRQTESDYHPTTEVSPLFPGLRMPAVHEIYDEAVRMKDSGNLEGAVAKLEEILAIDPAHVDTYSALAVYCQKLQRFDDAIRYANKVVEINPTDAFSYTQLSVIYMRCGKIYEAEEAKARAHAMGHGH